MTDWAHARPPRPAHAPAPSLASRLRACHRGLELLPAQRRVCVDVGRREVQARNVACFSARDLAVLVLVGGIEGHLRRALLATALTRGLRAARAGCFAGTRSRLGAA